MTINNNHRVHYARYAVRSYLWSKGQAIEEDETAVIDLLADLRHYCGATGLCFSDLAQIAEGHYVAEYHEP